MEQGVPSLASVEADSAGVEIVTVINHTGVEETIRDTTTGATGLTKGNLTQATETPKEVTLSEITPKTDHPANTAVVKDAMMTIFTTIEAV